MLWYKFHIKDFAADTSHLTVEEELAYRKLLDLYYDSEKPIPCDIESVARRLRLPTPAVASVLSEFWKKTGKGYINARAERELQQFVTANAAKKEAVTKRWKTVKEQQLNEDRYLSSDLQDDHKISYTIKKKNKNIPPISPKGDSRFAEFWAIWPATNRKVGRAVCEKRWEAGGLDEMADMIIAHVRVMKLTRNWTTGYDPSPATYLNQQRWTDGVPAETVSSERKMI
jgi:uncharacterized protein YdaU (DUF1376 family)